MTHPSATQGFTLIEMLVVIAILGILMAIGFGSYTRWRASSAVMEGAQQFARDMDRTRTNAKRDNSCWRIQPTAKTNTSSYTIQKFKGASCTVVDTPPQTRTLPAGTRLTYNAVSGTGGLSFVPPYGTTDASPNTYTVAWGSDANIKRTVRVTSVLGKTVLK
ncbi:pilus assembly FimT family protein [Deinococcus ficus]|uniref:pilus assembly FimT family protein n=1 Tax=Deinococcus ficus TaxID=317577 RepID=UPI0019B4E4FD|nr:type II secretion system protein [Deinococcus ficus]GHF89465.1 pili assembly chaperone [Deinococcus ficus]